MNQDTRNRLASLRVDVDEATAQRHLAAIGEALAEPPAAVATRPGWRFRLAPILASLTLLAAPAAAAAVVAESAMPGDLLYPVKQATEEVRSWFDPTVVIDHRLDELENAIDRAAPDTVIADRLDAAERALSDVDPAGTTVHSDRLDAVRRRIVDHTPPPTEPPATGRPAADSTPITDRPHEPADRSADTTTTTTQRDDHADTEDATSTTGSATTTSPPVRDADRQTEPGDGDAPRRDG